MSDTADAQGDFTIERGADAGDHARGGAAAGKAVETRDSVAEAARDAALSERTTGAKAQEDGFPEGVRRKYYVVASDQTKGGAPSEAHVYADERGEYLAFKATQDRLTTRLASTQVVHDMLAVAEHRAWKVVYLRGSVEFRREAWLEASARGMDAKGYEPTELDRQALAHRRAVREGANRRPPDSWSRSNANEMKRGDAYHSRKTADKALNKVTAIDAANGQPSAFRSQLSQGRWRARAEEFRAADGQAAARDADLVAAQSQLVIIEKALERALPHDPQARERILAAARERVAQHLRQGRSFERAMVRERAPAYDLSRDDRTEGRRNSEETRERTRQRER
jgi:hypothetical protein